MDKTQTLASSSIPLPASDQSQSSRGTTFVIEKNDVPSSVSGYFDSIAKNVDHIIHRIKYLEHVERERDDLLKRCRKLELCLQKKNNSFRQFIAHLTTAGYDALDDQSVQLQATFTVENDNLEMAEGGVDDQCTVSSAIYQFDISSPVLEKLKKKEKEGPNMEGESLILPTYGLFSQDVRLSSTAFSTTNMSETASPIAHSIRADGRDSLEETADRGHDDTPYFTKQEDVQSVLADSKEEVTLFYNNSTMRVDGLTIECGRPDDNASRSSSMVGETTMLMENKEDRYSFTCTENERNWIIESIKAFPAAYECCHEACGKDCSDAFEVLSNKMSVADIGKKTGKELKSMWMDMMKSPEAQQPGHTIYEGIKGFYISKEERAWLCKTIEQYPSVWHTSTTDTPADFQIITIMMNTRDGRLLDNRSDGDVEALWKNTLHLCQSKNGEWIRPLVKFYTDKKGAVLRARTKSTA